MEVLWRRSLQFLSQKWILSILRLFSISRLDFMSFIYLFFECWMLIFCLFIFVLFSHFTFSGHVCSFWTPFGCLESCKINW